VAFYVPLGPRGIIFRLGTFVIGIWGGLVYRLAYRRRAFIVTNRRPFRSVSLSAGIYAPLEVAGPLPVALVPGALLSDVEAPALV
jgi:hypothetical protein